MCVPSKWHYVERKKIWILYIWRMADHHNFRRPNIIHCRWVSLIIYLLLVRVKKIIILTLDTDNGGKEVGINLVSVLVGFIWTLCTEKSDKCLRTVWFCSSYLYIFDLLYFVSVFFPVTHNPLLLDNYWWHSNFVRQYFEEVVNWCSVNQCSVII